MAAPLTIQPVPEQSAVPAWLLNACFVLAVLNIVFFPAFYGRGWIFDAQGLGIPTDFVNVWSAGKLARCDLYRATAGSDTGPRA